MGRERPGDDEGVSLSGLGDYALMLIAKEIEGREKTGKYPLMAYLDDMIVKLNEDFRRVLRELTRDGVIAYHTNINGKIMFEFKKPEGIE